MGISETEKPKYKIMDFEEMSNNGLIWKINKEILHPLGLALARDGDTSPGCMIAPDGKWEFNEESNIRNFEKFQKMISPCFYIRIAHNISIKGSKKIKKDEYHERNQICKIR